MFIRHYDDADGNTTIAKWRSGAHHIQISVCVLMISDKAGRIIIKDNCLFSGHSLAYLERNRVPFDYSTNSE